MSWLSSKWVNHIGEIAELLRYASPTHGLITRIGKAHLEGFGSLEGGSLLSRIFTGNLRDHAGMVFV